MLGTLHYNCMVCLCLLNAPHVDLYIECWRALTFFIKYGLLRRNVKSTGQLLSQTAHAAAFSREARTSVLERKASGSVELVPLIKLMMCVGQISFCVRKPYRESSDSRRRLNHMTVSTEGHIIIYFHTVYTAMFVALFGNRNSLRWC